METMPHNQIINPKPLAWEAVKGQSRFAFLHGQDHTYIVMDDIDSAYATSGSTVARQSLAGTTALLCPLPSHPELNVPKNVHFIGQPL